MSPEKVYLIIRADRSVRVVRRLPRVRADEVVVLLNVHFPPGWGKVLSVVEINMPEFKPEVEALVEGLAPPPSPEVD